MSAGNEPDEFEQHAKRVLDESVTRVSGSVRSRLNQARQAAVAEIQARPQSAAWWRLPTLMPAAGAAAAVVLVAVVVIGNRGAEHGLPGVEGGQAAYEDIEMLSDNEGLELVESWDGSFYEWAAAEGEEGDSGASG